MNLRLRYPMLSFLAIVVMVIISYFFLDKPIAVYCRTLDQRITEIFQWITMLGVSTGYLIFSFILYLFFRFYKRRRDFAKRSLFLFLSIALSGIIAVIVKSILARFRPKMFFDENLFGFDLFRIGHEYNSFPSGHAVTVFALATALSVLFPKYRILFFCYALVISISRVIINAHYFGDVIAGAYVGILTVFLLAWCFQQFTGERNNIQHAADFKTT